MAVNKNYAIGGYQVINLKGFVVDGSPNDELYNLIDLHDYSKFVIVERLSNLPSMVFEWYFDAENTTYYFYNSLYEFIIYDDGAISITKIKERVMYELEEKTEDLEIFIYNNKLEDGIYCLICNDDSDLSFKDLIVIEDGYGTKPYYDSLATSIFTLCIEYNDDKTYLYRLDSNGDKYSFSTSNFDIIKFEKVG